ECRAPGREIAAHRPAPNDNLIWPSPWHCAVSHRSAPFPRRYLQVQRLPAPRLAPAVPPRHLALHTSHRLESLPQISLSWPETLARCRSAQKDFVGPCNLRTLVISD